MLSLQWGTVHFEETEVERPGALVVVVVDLYRAVMAVLGPMILCLYMLFVGWRELVTTGRAMHCRCSLGTDTLHCPS